jgi:hypothetical protein
MNFYLKHFYIYILTEQESGWLTPNSDWLLVGWLGFDSWSGHDFSLLRSVQTGSGVHQASYPVGTRDKADGA